ncbi:MAG: 50S ribosomal protein L7/L12 [Deltaproteobacteria bacterium]|nr:50S ribosomal protein L7/L12 [Deltaproteobacteria bacterium]MBK8241385.1 50S ribosomal protein L7/L12 [Deltaproteobacteria bacterium]MBK8717100.1 50S ribosomal protein L7/L12 [Deltaproteobacteria bacterium]
MTKDQVVEYLSNLPVMEIAALVKELEGKWGVSAAAPVAVAAAGGGGGAAAAPVEEKTEFTVVIKNGGDKKINVIKAVRELIPGIGLKEAKDMVDGAPATVKEGVSKEEAETMVKKLKEAGADAEMK